MNKILLLSVTLVLLSCKDQRLYQYEKMVDDAGKFEISYPNIPKIINIPKYRIESFKDVLKRNVKPELPRNIVEDVRVNIYKNNNRIGFLRITNGKTNPFVNFNSNNLNFGFRLTYGLGMFIDNIHN